MVDTGSPVRGSCPLPPCECSKLPMSTAIRDTQKLFCSIQDEEMLVIISSPAIVVALQIPAPNWYFLPSFCPV